MYFYALKHRLKISTYSFFAKMMPRSSFMVFVGVDSSKQLCAHLARTGATRVLVVTDRILVDLGLVDGVIKALQQHNIEPTVFDGVTPDPTYAVVASGVAIARDSRCDTILAIGGGSSIDTAKVIAASMTNGDDPQAWVGFGKLKTSALPLYAIPTTSGTGSEATRAAVISDNTTHAKSIIGDNSMSPAAIALDSSLLQGMPPAITAATGIDALTHAIEAYIGTWDHGDAMDYAQKAVKLVFDNLSNACKDGSNLAARESMALAAFYAGAAINQVNVGNVHAIAHQLGSKYGVPHGVANAIVLPHILEQSMPVAEERLAQLARCAGIEMGRSSNKQLATAFIDRVVQLQAEIGLPTSCNQLKEEDLPQLTRLVLAEAFDYPTPVLLNEQQVSKILRNLLTDS